MPKHTPTKTNANIAMARHLTQALSDTYVLAIKTHGYHWNVKGPLFAPLHAFFGEMYEQLTDAADEIAERIRALGLMPEGSMKGFLENTVIKEANAKAPDAKGMLKDLLHSHQQVRARLAEAEAFAGDVGDVATQDMMVERLRAHDKTIWMLRSQIT